MSFVEFCLAKINEQQIELSNLKDTLSNLQPSPKYKSSKYPTRKEQIIAYRSITKCSFIKSVFISNEELQSFFLKQEIDRLKKEIKKLENSIEELQKVEESIDQGVFNKEIYPNRKTTQAILEYSIKYNIPIEKNLVLIISLFKHNSHLTESLTAKMEFDIANCFDEEYNVKEGIEASNIIFMLEKLLNIFLKAQEKDKYHLLIENLKNTILSKAKDAEKEDYRQSLLKEQKALNLLSKYIKGNKVVVPAKSLAYFKNLVKKSHLPAHLEMSYISQMSDLLDEIEERKNNILINKHLTEAEKEIYYLAKDSLSKTEDETVKELIKHGLKSIVSICRYFELELTPEEKDISYEVLTEKLNYLIRILNITKEENVDKCTFWYVTNRENIPEILRNIEYIDILLYNQIAELLERLAKNDLLGVLIGNVKGVNIYSLNSPNLRLLFSRNDSKTVIIGVVPETTNPMSIIDSRTVNQIKRYFATRNTNKINKIHASYERLILKSLELTSPEEYVLKKV